MAILSNVPVIEAASNIIGTYTAEGILRDQVGIDTGFASGNFPAVNKCLFYPITVARPFNAVEAWVNNGTAVSGNFDIGWYDEAGVRQWSTGTTAQSGTSTIQIVSMTDFIIPRGRWYLGFACDNTTATFNRTNLAVIYLQMLGCFEQLSTYPLPSNATFAVPSGTGFVPLCGVTNIAGGI